MIKVGRGPSNAVDSVTPGKRHPKRREQRDVYFESVLT
jgi:hypothetical protein